MNRRQWLMGGSAAGLAAAAGVAVSLTRQPDARQAALQRLWAARFATPDGGELSLGALRGRPLVVNFWATWCPPCVRELPQFDRFRTMHAAAGWQVIGLALDNATAVRGFLQRQPVAFPIGLAQNGGSELMRGLGNTQGALPFTVVFNAGGEPVQQHLGETSLADLEGWAKTL
jgi:thiol-disulfide isomerase/thioredoxin